MARGWKRLAERGLVGARVDRLAAVASRPATLIVAYHNVVPDGETVVGDASLHIDRATFARQLDLMCERGDVVSLSQAMEPRVAGARPRIVVTFDDAYRGAMTAGLDELARRELRATVFVPPGLLGSEGFWWDRLAQPDDEQANARVRNHVLTALQGRGDQALAWARSEGVPVHPLPDHARPVEEHELLDIASRGVFTFGAHTWSHPNLCTLDAGDTLDELSRSRDWLAGAALPYVDWLAYPYGLHDEGVVALARDLYDGALRVDGGAFERRGRKSKSNHEVPRLNVARGVSLEGLALRLSGLLA